MKRSHPTSCDDVTGSAAPAARGTRPLVGLWAGALVLLVLLQVGTARAAN